MMIHIHLTSFIVWASCLELTKGVDDSLSHQSCLSWEIDTQKKLTLKCSLSNFDHDVIIYGIDGEKKAYCHFRAFKAECSCTNKKSNITAYMKNKTVLFSEFYFDENNVNGIWYCQQNSTIKTTMVSSYTGIIVDSNVVLEGKINNESRHYILTCSSCREPKHSKAEFLMNGKTIDTVSYSRQRCYNKNGLCQSRVCYCSTYSFTLAIRPPINVILRNFSCLMHFEDSRKGLTFDKTASITLLFNGIFNNITKTKIVRQSDLDKETTCSLPNHLPNNENYDTDTCQVLVGVFGSVIVLVLSVGIVIHSTKTRNKKAKKESTKHQDEKAISSTGVPENVIAKGEESQSLLGETRRTRYGSTANDDTQMKCELCHEIIARFVCSICFKIYCTICFKAHQKVNTNHECSGELLGRHDLDSKNNHTVCKACSVKPGTIYCKNCMSIYCSDCVCRDHTNTLYSIKYGSSSSNFKGTNQTTNYDFTYKYSIKLRKTDIENCIYVRGIAFLTDGRLVIADAYNQKIIVFNGEKSEFEQKLLAEPRGLSAIDHNAFAVTFGHTLEIHIFKVNENGIDCVKKVKMEKLKPFSITYSNHYFAVESGECDAGCILILQDDLSHYKTIHNERTLCYFTGNTIRLALDMEKEKCVYVSALSKSTIICIDVERSEVKWHVTIPSPRGICFVPGKTESRESVIVVASRRCSAVFRINGEPKESEVLTAGEETKFPRNIAYHPGLNLLCIEATGSDNPRTGHEEFVVYQYIDKFI